MVELEKYWFLIAAAASGLASFVATRVSFGKDIQFLKDENEKRESETKALRDAIKSEFREISTEIRDATQEVSDRIPAQTADFNRQVTSMNTSMQNLNLEIQTLKIKGGQADEKNKHFLEMLERSNGLIDRLTEKSDQHQQSVIHQLSQLSTKLDERTSGKN